MGEREAIKVPVLTRLNQLIDSLEKRDKHKLDLILAQTNRTQTLSLFFSHHVITGISKDSSEICPSRLRGTAGQ